MGWDGGERILDRSQLPATPELSHSQVQTLPGSIGARKGYNIWVPSNDRNKLDWSLTDTFDCCSTLPMDFDKVRDILTEIDVMWVERGAGRLHAMFEVE